MARYFTGFALSYAAALLVFAALGTVSLFRWPMGDTPAFFSVLWCVLPLLTCAALSRYFSTRWSVTNADTATWILLAVLLLFALLSWRVEALTPFSAPGRQTAFLFTRLLSLPAQFNLPLTLCVTALYPVLFRAVWKIGA